MEARETVMSPQTISKVKGQWVGGQSGGETPENELLKAQAEHTGKIMYDEGFKAGYDQGVYDTRITPEAQMMFRRIGIKEVVEYGLFLEKNYSHTDWGNMQFRMDMLDKLKEWGIDAQKGM